MCVCVFHMNFRIDLSYFCKKNATEIFIVIALNLWMALGNMDILTVLILPFSEHRISCYLFVSLISFISDL